MNNIEHTHTHTHTLNLHKSMLCMLSPNYLRCSELPSEHTDQDTTVVFKSIHDFLSILLISKSPDVSLGLHSSHMPSRWQFSHYLSGLDVQIKKRPVATEHSESVSHQHLRAVLVRLNLGFPLHLGNTQIKS